MHKSNIPKLTDVVTEDTLKIFLQGFFLNSGLAVGIYVEPGRPPILNESDLNPICLQHYNQVGRGGCSERNIALAARVLIDTDKKALKELESCPFGLQHVVEPIWCADKKRIVAILCLGGVLTNKEEAKSFLEKFTIDLYMDQISFKDRGKRLKEYATDLQNYYNAHLKMIGYTDDRQAPPPYNAARSDIPEFLDIINNDLDETFERILSFLNTWTNSRLSALCILDPQAPYNDPTNDYLVVRHVVGLTELESERKKNLKGPEFLKVSDSFVGRAIISKKIDYVEDLKPEDFKWFEAVRELDTRKALVIPLILPDNRLVLGVLICFPGRAIWRSRLPMFVSFARRVAVSIYSATRNELYKRSRIFSKRLLEVSSMTGIEFYSDMAELIRTTLDAAAASIFIIDRTSRYLRLVGTTDQTQNAKYLVGSRIYRIGEGITGFIAAELARRPYGEIVYNLYDDKRRSPKFEEYVPETRNNSHSMMATQVISPGGEVVGVIRCVDVVHKSNAVFNCFNHFYLEGLQFWAGIFGIIYTMKEGVRLNHEFMLTFVHEFGSSLMGLRNNLELVKRNIETGNSIVALRKLDDAVMLAVDIMTPPLQDVELTSLIMTKGEWSIEQPREEELWLEKDILMPMKNAFQDEARRERHIDIHYEPLPVSILVDRKQIIQVFSNLIRNAIKYSFDPKNKAVTPNMLADIKIRPYFDDRGALHIDFENQGIGIDEDEKKVVFELHRKGRNAGIQSAGGLGLGLFICKTILRFHGGDVFVKSGHNPTIITMRLPSFRVLQQ
ncbi:MAG: ATP-binding protein [candidate division Zixibacteria bacterium]|nr:ATP-binding protein [candidate division Zixibacteria bacterium]